MRLLVSGLKGGVGRTMLADSLRYVAKKEGMDLEVIDGHARLNCDLRAKAKRADMVLLVAEEDVFGQMELSFMLAGFHKEGLATAVVYNKVSPWSMDKRQEEEADQADPGAQFLLDQGSFFLGRIPQDERVAGLLDQGLTLAQADPGIYQMLKDLLDRMQETDSPAPNGDE